MITERELENIRKEQAKYLPSKGQIKRREFFGDTENEYFPINDTLYPCRATPGFGMWTPVADRFQGITAFTITVVWDVDLRAGDLIVIGERAFEIRDVKAPGSYLTARQCLADLVSDG